MCKFYLAFKQNVRLHLNRGLAFAKAFNHVTIHFVSDQISFYTFDTTAS